MIFRKRTASRKAQLLASASYTDFRRLTPAENAKIGLSPKARHYVLKSAKRISKSTPTISARQHETKRAQALFKLSPEQATEARKQGAISYKTARQRESVAKAKNTHFSNTLPDKIDRDVRRNARIEGYKGKPHYRLTRKMGELALTARARKLAGEYLPDGEWHAMVDVAKHYNDPKYEYLRASPGSFSIVVEE